MKYIVHRMYIACKEQVNPVYVGVMLVAVMVTFVFAICWWL